MEHRVVRLTRGAYKLTEESGGQLQIVAGVTLVGHEGVVLSGEARGGRPTWGECF